MEYTIPGKIERIFRILSIQYKETKHEVLLQIIVNGKYSVEEQTSWDNWNGGIAGHTIHFILNDLIFQKAIEKRDEYADKLKKDINNIIAVDNEFIDKIDFDISDEDYEDDWREKTGSLAQKQHIPIHVEDTNRIWSIGGFRIFISHKVSNKVEASKLKESLKPFGISCFVAHEDIEPSTEWQREIEKALHSMDLMIALLSKDFHESNWTDQEIGFALGRQIKILPVNIGINPYGFIGNIQALKGIDGYHKEILRKLYENKEIQQRLIDCYIEALKSSTTFANSEIMAEVLKYFPELSETQRNNFILAFNSNSQVNGCWTFNGKKTGVQNSNALKAINKGSRIVYTINRDQIEIDF